MSVNTEPGLNKSLKYSTAVLVMGIASFFGYFAYILPGLALSIVALILSKKANALYKANPDLYTKDSYGRLKTGKVIALVGLVIIGVIGSLFLVYGLLYSLSDLKD
ncbi:MAG: hypothetical protein JWR38_5385 [Mucilaginibacter sp.]|jgi:hypothetical protein|nr:hypothetical protein [Mucilaginibacter sp.]